ncbi:MAG: segregation/condensation protein A [Phycisphaerales bacterium]|nr:segregation/condensation protein A [Phycisphaerales bacterium]
MTVEYRVQLGAFEGPLDLLLFLIRRAEVDVTDIPVAQIAEQYMQYLAGIERIDIDVAGEFLVMAATLMEIKSRMLAPPAADESDAAPAEAPAGGSNAPEDPRADLVRQLLAYKKFRDASDALESRRSEWDRRFPAGRAGVDDEALRAEIDQHAAGIDLEDVSLVDLVESFSKIMATVNFDRLGEHTVVYDDTPIEVHAEDLLDRLRREAPGAEGFPLPAVFAGRTRPEMIGLFLAVLELVRRRAVRVTQGDPGGTIRLSLRDEDPAPLP